MQQLLRHRHSAFILFSLLLISAHSFSANLGGSGGEGDNSTNEEYNFFDNNPLYGGWSDNTPSKLVNPGGNTSTPELKSKSISGKTTQELEDVYADAPEDVCDIVNHLKNPICPEWRLAFLVGPPGTGKTTTMLAIPHMAGWDHIFISAPEIGGKYRNETKIRLSKVLEAAVKRQKKTVICIDEINLLVEGFNNKKCDDAVTAGYLWTFLDKNRLNPNIFVIGTMNRDTHLPPQIKQRFAGGTIYFKELPPQQKVSIFKKIILRNPHLKLDPECDDTFINHCLTTLGGEGVAHSPRDYENIGVIVSRFACRDNNTNNPISIVNRDHIRRALISLMNTYQKSEFYQEKLTDEERSDFAAIQSKIIDIKLQCAQKIHAGISYNNNSPTARNGSGGFSIGRAPGLDMDQAIEIIESEFSPKQIALYKKVMKRDYLIERSYFDKVKKGTRLAKDGTLKWTGMKYLLNFILPT